MAKGVGNDLVMGLPAKRFSKRPFQEKLSISGKGLATLKPASLLQTVK